MLQLLPYVIALILVIALSTGLDYVGKYDFDYTFKKWFINIHIKSE